MARTEAILTTTGEAATNPAFEMLAYGPRAGDFRIGLAPIALEHWFEGASDDPAPRKDALLASTHRVMDALVHIEPAHEKRAIDSE